MQSSKYQVKTGIERVTDVLLAKAEHAPAMFTQVTVTPSIAPLLRCPAMPVIPIALYNEAVCRERKIHGAITDGELMPRNKTRLCKGNLHGRFETAAPHGYPSAQLGGTTSGAGTKSLDQTMSHHDHFPTDLAGHRIRPAFVVIASVPSKVLLGSIRTLNGAKHAGAVLGSKCNNSGGEGLAAFRAYSISLPEPNRAADTMVMIPMAATTKTAKAVRIARPFDRKDYPAMFTGCC